MGRSKWIRPVSALVAVAVIVAGCSSDDDSSSDSTVAATTETTEASAPTTEAELTGEGLDLALLAPSPGLLATLFLGQERGSGFAADDVNDGGGVLDGPLTITNSVAEAGAEPTVNVQAAVDSGAQALIGPGGSADIIEVRDEIAALDSTACSASASLPSASLGQDPLSLVRTVLPDDITSTYLATEIIARRDEVAPGAAWKVAIVARTDAYGQSIGNSLAAILESAGLQPSVVGYNPRRVTFTGTAQEVVALQPDLSILVTYEEGANLLSALVTAGIDPATMLGLDAFFQPRIAELATAGTDATAVDGFQALGSVGNKAFLERLYEDDPNGQVANAAQAYDCAIMLSLATATVDAGDADDLAQAMIAVTGDGVTCTTYADCLDKLNAGENINYDGVSGQIQLDDNGDPTFARFTTAKLEGGVVSSIESTDVDIADIRRQQEAYASAAFYTQLQLALQYLGFYTGPINGINTPETQAALAAFQASVGLPATGVWDEATAAAMATALGENAALLAESTRDIQQLMTDLGYYTGPIDGIWNQELTDAIKALQRDLGVPETGVIDSATLRAIYAAGLATGSTTTTTVPPATTIPPETTAPPTTAPPTTAPPTPETTAPTTTVPEQELKTLLETLRADENYTIFVRVVDAADVPDTFDRFAKYTVIAPNDDAFAGFDYEGLINDPAAAANFVLQLLIEDETSLVADLPLILETVYGSTLDVVRDSSGTSIGGALVVDADRPATNGVIQGVSTLPRADSLTEPRSLAIMARRVAAVFDLDRTLITSSSATVFRKHLAEHGLGGGHDLPLVDVFTRFYEQFGETWLLMQPARLASRASAGWSTATIAAAMQAAADELATMLLPGATKAIEEHRAAGRLLVMATTSPRPFVEPFAERLGFDATVATRWEREDRADGEVFTGRMDGPFVWGRTKADAVATWATENDVDLSDSWAYSDSYFDASLLASVGHPVAVNPDTRLRIAATIRGWPVTHFDRSEGVSKILGRELQDWGRPFMRQEIVTPNARIEFDGIENIPATGPAILVFNHRSYFDPLVMGLVIAKTGRSVRGLGKKEVFDVPIVGRLMKASGGIRVDRGTGSDEPLDAAIAAVEAGELLMIAPEGTIPRGPAFFDPVLKGRWGAARIAAATGAPVIPIGLWGTEKVWPRSARLPKLSLTDRPLVTATAGPPVKLNYRSADADTKKIMKALSALLPPEARVRRTPSPEELALTYPAGYHGDPKAELDRRPGTDT